MRPSCTSVIIFSVDALLLNLLSIWSSFHKIGLVVEGSLFYPGVINNSVIF